jgi:hypothetical protein
MTHDLEDHQIYRETIMEQARKLGNEAELLANDLPPDRLNDCIHMAAQVLNAVFRIQDPPIPECWRGHIVIEALNIISAVEAKDKEDAEGE